MSALTIRGAMEVDRISPIAGMVSPGRAVPHAARSGDTEHDTRRRGIIVLFDGPSDFLYPDGTHTVVTVHAGQRGGRWSGSLRLPNGDRRLERGDVCRLTHDRFDGEMRIVITEQAGSNRYNFIGLIKPDPWETL